jgi:hypothetical protein
MIHWMQWLKDVFFYLIVILLFLTGAAVLLIHELGRIRRTWKHEMKDKI